MHKTKFAKVVAVALAFLFAVGTFICVPDASLFSITAYADAAEDRDNEGKKNNSEDIDFWNDINIDQSFAYQIRMATNYANRMAAQKVKLGGKSGGYSGKLDMSNIGVFFGYTDGEIETDTLSSPENSRTSKSSASSVDYSRALMYSYNDDFSNKYVSNYANYGLMLNLMGFDAVGSSAPDTRRGVFGIITLGSYYAASFVNVMFQMMFDVLIDTNPFQFFKDINSTSAAGQAELQNISADAIAASGSTKDSMAQLSKYFSDIYNMFTDFAWSAAIPMAIIFLVVAFFLTRSGRMNVGSNIKKVIVRVLFLAMGIPILGSAYTQTLDALKDAQTMSDEFLTQAVSYTFLDFGEWVENRRLTPLGDNYKLITIAHNSGDGSTTGTVDGSSDAAISASVWMNLRQMCSEMNEANGVFEFTDKFLGVNDDTGALLKDFIYDVSESNPTLASTATSSGSVAFDNRQAVTTVINKYMNGTKYTAEMFETGTIGNLRKTDNYGDLLALSCDKYSFSQNAERTVRGLQGKTKFYDPDKPEDASPYSDVAGDRFEGFSDFGDYGNIWCNGTIKGTYWSAASGGGGSGSSAPGYGVSYSAGSSVDSKGEDKGLDPTENMGFSTMSMYTYLTTSFSQTGLVVYGGAPSVYTQNSHYAVNLIGGNYIMQFAFFANMIAILLGYFALGVCFIFRTAFDIIFKGIQLMGHALLAAVGFYKSIGTCICMTVNMIAQLFMSVIFFSFMVDFMFIMTSFCDHVLKDVFVALGGTQGSPASNLGNMDEAYQAELLVIVSSLLATFVIIFFVCFAIRWRAAIMSSINSMVEGIIGTLLGVNLSGSSEGAMGGMAMAALRDTANIAKMGTAVAGGTALANGALEMGQDVRDSAVETFGGDDSSGARPLQGDGNPFAEPKSAVEGAADATIGAGFDGGVGKIEGDNEISKADTEELLANGIPDEHGSTGGHEAGGGGAGGRRDTVNDADSKGSATGKTSESTETRDYNDVGYHYGGTAAEQNAAETEASVSDDGNGGTIINRNGTGSKNSTETTSTTSSESSDESDGSAIELGLDTKGGIIRKKTSKESSSESTETTDSSDETTSSSTASTTTTAAATANSATGTDISSETITETSDSNADVTSSVGEDVQGKFWSQTNPSTGTETSARFDMARGLVIGMTDENGNVSDVAIGMNGITTSTVDDAGNKQTTQISQNGIQSTYTGVDGTTETVTADVNGADSSVVVNRTDADGNTEEIVTNANGTTMTRTETAADGSTRTLTTDDAGNQTITEKNASTGYESVETISTNGDSTKTESINGVTTVTNSDSDGNLVSQEVTKTDANGNEVKTTYSVDESGNMTSSVTSNGVTDTTITGADGSRTEVQSVVRSDGTVVETTTEYGNDAIADSTKTVVKSANGMEIIGIGDVTTGTDSVGAYTSSTVTTDKGSLEIKDYGSGHVVTTETANGIESVSEVKSDGSRVITETDSATGNVRVATISSSGTGETVLKNSSGETISTEKIAADSNGSSSYTMMNGGSVTFSTVGEGADKEHVVAQTYATGGQNVVSTNAKTGSQTATVVDGLGSQSVTSVDAKTGNVTTEFKHASGNAGISILDGSTGSFRQEVSLAGGGAQTIVRSGAGADAVETVSKVDGAGNTMFQQSTGGRVDRVEATTGGNASFVQERGENGSVITHQVLESGAVVNKTQQANGDYIQETVNTNGSRTYTESTGGVERTRNVSITGIETTAMRSGSAMTETTNFENIAFTNTMDNNGQSTATFRTTTGQVYTMSGGSNGGTKTTFETGDGNVMSYQQNADGSAVNIIRNASGSSRVENIATNGTSNIVYVDAQGNSVNAPAGADTYNDVMGQAFKGFTAQNQGVQIPNNAAGQRIIFNDVVAERNGSLNLNGNNGVEYVQMGGTSGAGTVQFTQQGNANGVQFVQPNGMNNVGAGNVQFVQSGNTVAGNTPNVTFEDQNGVQFNGLSGIMPTGTAATAQNIGMDNTMDITTGGTTNVRVHGKRKSKTSFLESLFGGMVNADEEETQAAVSAAEGTAQRKLNGAETQDKLKRRTSSGSMGDYDTRKGGSASGGNDK